MNATDATETLSLTDKARRLATLARSHAAAQDDDQELIRLETHLTKLGSAINGLDRALTIHAHLQTIGVPVQELPDLSKDYEQLRDQVDRIGRPTWQFLSTRANALMKVSTLVAEADRASWNSWTSEKLQALPLPLLPRLGATRRSIETKLAELKRLANDAPTLQSLGRFQIDFGDVQNALAKVESAGVDAVLEKFINGKTLLADLSDEELTMLRADESLRTQLYVALQ